MDMHWNLDKLYTSFDSPQFRNDYEALKAAVAEISQWANENLRETSNPQGKLEWFIRKENEIANLFNMHSYTHLTLSTETTNERAMKYEDALSTLSTGLTAPDALFRLFVGKIENLDEVISGSELLREHEFYLKEIAADSKHRLSEAEETIIAKMQITGSDAWESMKGQLVSLLMVEVDLPDGKKTMPLQVVRNLAHDPDQKVRKAAYEAELDSYKKVDRATAYALNSIKGEVLTTSKLRGYESPLAMTLIQSRMKPETLDAMMGAIEEALPSLRRFYRAKAKHLGHQEGLPFYDVFAPLGSTHTKFTYEQARDYIVKNFSTFSPKLGAFAARAFDENWIDAEPREGKRGGAFCSNIHTIGESRILANFTGTFSDVITLAHELGHGYHGDCLKDETYLNSDYTMPIAETASTFCETIVTNAALAVASEDERLALLESQITDMLQVIVDIYARFLFESGVFEKRADGPLSVTEFNELMLDSQKKAYGDGLDPEHLHTGMWINKVHYYYAGYNFYNFPYAYGLLFALGLYAEYQRTGEAFLPKYDALLAATGKNSLEDIGKLAGIDVTSRDFWATSLKYIEDKVDEFCKL